ncbi:hypothetical protein DYB32_008854 [Aphanomyces invadans]|uniref:PX domain-containing protein n=1 Tax=Aphanomyces invadans TaxID=157072 RepID=A0A418AJY5_9STRA|nr:hypothetical protein DYB32_008854 [Aphanomyces invadans]
MDTHEPDNNQESQVRDERRRGLSVHISHVDRSPIQQTQYVIRVTDLHADSYERTVRRPYSEFRRFRFHILDILGRCSSDKLSRSVAKEIDALSFPPKRFFGSRSESVVRTRADALNKWITSVLAITTEYRKTQKNLAMGDATVSTQGSAILLDALKTFLTSRVEEIHLLHPIPLEKTQSVPMPLAVDMKGRAAPQRHVSSSNYDQHERSDNQEPTLQHATAAPQVAPPSWTANDINNIATSIIKSTSKSILKSNDRCGASSGNGIRKVKTRFSIAEPSETFSSYNQPFSSSSSTSNSSEEASHTYRSSSSSTAPSSAEGSFVSTRTKTTTSRASLANGSTRTKSMSTSYQSCHSMHQNRGSLVKDARFSMAQPKVVKRLPAGDEADIVAAAEAELQSMHLTPDVAAMVLRYMDRFLVKATQRQPGCYRITPDNWLAIDAERLYTELEDALFDPSLMHAMLFRGGEWRIPPALEGYIQHKWAVHHNKAMDEKADDSDDDESDTQVEVHAKSTRKTLARFSRHDIDEIEQLMSEGTASRSQVKQLRRQLDEGNWDRHAAATSSRRAIPVMGSASDDDDSLGEEDDIDFETYARRKSQKTRASTFHDRGGLV